MVKIYAGIGSRRTPDDVLRTMRIIGANLAREGWTLRSGGADGADTAFELGADDANGEKEIYLPWREFNGNKSLLFPPSPEAMQIAKSAHPTWDRLTYGGRKLMARNTHQIMGPHVQPPQLRIMPKMVICWTPKGDGSGGTSQALKLAKMLDIPIFDLDKLDFFTEIRALTNFIELHNAKETA